MSLSIVGLVEDRDGWTWPRSDRHAYPWLTRTEADVPSRVLAHVAQRRSCIQAGGNCGLYAAEYAGAFEAVHTWEPDAVNFYCLAANACLPNVFATRAALGPHPGSVDMVTTPQNCGAHYVTSGSGTIRMVTIDAYGLDDVDLIHLDMEGYEGPCLEGARETIAKCRPVIACEVYEHGRRYGWPSDRLHDFIVSLGYQEAERFKHERVWIPA